MRHLLSVLSHDIKWWKYVCNLSLINWKKRLLLHASPTRFHCGTMKCFSYQNVLTLRPVPSGTAAEFGWTFHCISNAEKLKYLSFKEMLWEACLGWKLLIQSALRKPFFTFLANKPELLETSLSHMKWSEEKSHSVMSAFFETPWTVGRQSPLSMEFSRQECWSELPFPSPHSTIERQ